MPTGDAYSSGHLFPPNFGLVYVLVVETNPFPEVVVIFLDYARRTYLGTFSILLIRDPAAILIDASTRTPIEIGFCKVSPFEMYLTFRISRECKADYVSLTCDQNGSLESWTDKIYALRSLNLVSKYRTWI